MNSSSCVLNYAKTDGFEKIKGNVKNDVFEKNKGNL